MKSFMGLLLLFSALCSSAQAGKIDSLKKIIVSAKDTQRVNILNQISEQYLYLGGSSANESRDSILHIALQYADDAQSLSARLNYKKGIGVALFNSGNINIWFTRTNNQEGLASYKEAIPFLEQAGDKINVAKCFYNAADIYHMIGKLNEAISYFDTSENLYIRLKDTINAVFAYGMKGHCYFDEGKYKEAYELGIGALKLAEQSGNRATIVFALSHLGNLFLGADLPQSTIDYMHKVLLLYPGALDKKPDESIPGDVYWALMKGGEAFLKLNQVDSALKIAQIVKSEDGDGDNQSFYGHLYTALQQSAKALTCFLQGYKVEQEIDHKIGIARHANELGQAYLAMKNFDQAIYYANNALTTAQSIRALLEMKNAVGTLRDIYIDTKNYEQIYRYSRWYNSLSDSIAPDEYRQKLSLLQIQDELDNQKEQALLLTKENQIKEQQLSQASLIRKIFIAGILALILVAAIVFRNYRQKQKANILLQEQKKEIQDTLLELKSTQSQLVQSAKMASLGELTAGIAHEIQNPLNFVNNFSEVSNELIDEMKAELANNNKEEAIAIADDLKQNLQKINHHGKRADSIVKGMLQHSRAGTGHKEPTDINGLVDEYLRLAYQGLRAKDKLFNATLITDFDKNIDKFNIIPQDIGRVLLNLYNNAFYAVNEKTKGIVSSIVNSADKYEPTVSVSTKKSRDRLLISVKDNGNGIPHNIVDKIFQPFFTTKPTGQGTGLGLSLAYDIIKAHGGEIKVETKENGETVFIVSLPAN